MNRTYRRMVLECGGCDTALECRCKFALSSYVTMSNIVRKRRRAPLAAALQDASVNWKIA